MDVRSCADMSRRFTAVINKEGKWYVAHCVELGVVSQGKSIEEAQVNLKEAVELYLESFGDEDMPESSGEVLLYPLEVTVGD
jgi:predicted RNase H-like HicB family nuclease